jgi:pilus assembly protein CpaB
MSIRTLFVVAFALVFGGSAAMGVNSLVNTNRGAGSTIETVPVVVAAVDIPRGGTISVELIKIRQFPKELVPNGILTKQEDALDRAVFSPLVKDEPVLDGKLSPKGSGRGMAALVPAGMRAFTIQTTNIASGVAGFVMPGNRVDVLLTMNGAGVRDHTGGAITTTLLQNLEILAVDQRIDAPVDNKVDPNQLRSVTLLVTPEQAKKLDLGQNKGTLHLSLRNPDDHRRAEGRPATLAGLEGYQEAPWDVRAKGVIDSLGKVLALRPPVEARPAPAESAQPTEIADPAPAPRAIRIYRGTQWSLAN